MAALHPDALALIESFEGCPPHPEWPGGDSGITIGIGCDIGADPDSLALWRPWLPADDYQRLERVTGLTGDDAEAALDRVRSIAIPADAAGRVLAVQLGATAALVRRTFPGAEGLPEDSFGALVSLVYNRGAKLEGSRRAEMAAIRDTLEAGKDWWPRVIEQLGRMTRLWGPPSPFNLSGRRLCEAALFAQGLDRVGLLPPGTLYLGRSGPPVAALQRMIGCPADGEFGRATMLAVFSCQGRAGKPQTGVWTP